LSSNREKSDEHEHRGGRNHVPSDPDLRMKVKLSRALGPLRGMLTLGAGD
jgi:hypothetical protein